MGWRKSIIHSELPGYASCDCHEKYVLNERDTNLKIYLKSFDVTSFGDGSDTVYRSFAGKTKRIRIVRDLSESKLFQSDKSGVDLSWFLRLHALSKFVQAVRMVILKRRLENRLNILKRLKAVAVEREHPNMYRERTLEINENPCKSENLLCPPIVSLC